MNNDQQKLIVQKKKKNYTDCTNNETDERPSFKDLIQIFETIKSIWIGGYNEEFRKYIKKCKEINQETKEKHKNLFLHKNISLSPNDSSSSNLSREKLKFQFQNNMLIKIN